MHIPDDAIIVYNAAHSVVYNDSIPATKKQNWFATLVELETLYPEITKEACKNEQTRPS